MIKSASEFPGRFMANDKVIFTLRVCCAGFALHNQHISFANPFYVRCNHINGNIIKMMYKTETIAAISTAMSNSGIGIVRISGDEAVDIICRMFTSASGKNLREEKSHTIHYGNITDNDEILDEVLVLLMKAPHTYTREDTIEIDCHGGTFVVNRVLELAIKNGARLAEPGEFTKRAFINGRIDLAQAEAVIDVINAENKFALQSAVTQLKGSVSDKIRHARAVLLEQIAYIEAALDDPEHYDLFDYGETLLPIVCDIKEEITTLIETSDDGRIIKEGIQTVILGKPNVGKSSLLNTLLGVDRAIVTDIAGTTRDALEERIRIGDILLNIIDTAGIRETDDVIEKIGVDKAREYAAMADLIIFVVDASRSLDQDDRRIAEIIKNKKTIVLLNKQDLESRINKSELEELLPCPFIETSLTENTGLDEFAAKLREMFYNKEIDFNNQVFITNARQKADLKDAEAALQKAVESIESGMPEDFYTIDLMAAYEALSSVIGESIDEDLVNEIFSKFCMGK